MASLLGTVGILGCASRSRNNKQVEYVHGGATLHNHLGILRACGVGGQDVAAHVGTIGGIRSSARWVFMATQACYAPSQVVSSNCRSTLREARSASVDGSEVGTSSVSPSHAPRNGAGGRWRGRGWCSCLDASADVGRRSMAGCFSTNNVGEHHGMFKAVNLELYRCSSCAKRHDFRAPIATYNHRQIA